MILLDTNAWLRWTHCPETIPRATRKLVEEASAAGELLVSVISVWEIATKAALGKLSLPLPVGKWVELASRAPGLRIVPLTEDVAMDSAALPGVFRKDPADRIVVALARRESAVVVTSDRKILDYPHVIARWN